MVYLFFRETASKSGERIQTSILIHMQAEGEHTFLSLSHAIFIFLS